MHKAVEPAILYFGTPVVLISTTNPDGSANLAPMSSIWWLGWSCMIGLDASSQTLANLLRTGECVLNLPSADLVASVDKLAKTTGSKRIPLHKKVLGYVYAPNKFALAGFTEQSACLVNAPRVAECPVQLEAKHVNTYPFGECSAKMAVPTVALELHIERVHVCESLLVDATKSYVDPDKWHPLIMNFRQFYSTGDYIHPAKLAEGDEDRYAPWKRSFLARKLMAWMLARNTKPYREAVSGEENDTSKRGA